MTNGNLRETTLSLSSDITYVHTNAPCMNAHTQTHARHKQTLKEESRVFTSSKYYTKHTASCHINCRLNLSNSTLFCHSLLQHSLISPAFIQVLGLKGIVNKVDGDGDVLVECINSTKYAGDRAPFAQC